MRFIRKFLSDEDGAVTVDWVMLCAGTLLLGLSVVSVVAPGTQTLLKTELNAVGMTTD
jgi:Flp pilus assembly pilin Flp